MKLTIFYKRQYDFKGSDGEQVNGAIYAGFPDKGTKVIKFSSRNIDREVNENITKYDERLAEEVNLITGFDEQRMQVKYSEKIEF